MSYGQFISGIWAVACGGAMVQVWSHPRAAAFLMMLAWFARQLDLDWRSR